MEKVYKFFRDNYFYFFIYAFLGWIYEELWYLIVENKIVNRGFLYGPYLPIYGFGALLLLLLLHKQIGKKIKLFGISITPILIFIIIFIITTLVEYIAHYILDEYFNIILWDYSKDFLNINGRVCLAASRNFAIGGTTCFYFVQPFLTKFFSKLKNSTKNILFIILFLIVIVDFIITIIN